MPRESIVSKKERVLEVCRRMNELYPEAECALDYTDPFSLVIAVLLSAQTTDASVNKVTPVLFERWPGPAALAQAPLSEVEDVLHPLGFFRSKARHVIDASQMIMAEFGGEVPRTMEELTRLPGVGRKTANIVLNNAFDIVEGIAVDTHVHRIATRLGFTKAAAPLDAEQDLLKLIPQELWKPVNHQWVLFGRHVCDAKKPACVAGEPVSDIARQNEQAWAQVGAGMPCPLADVCPSCGKAVRVTKKAKKTTKKTAQRTSGKTAGAKGKTASGTGEAPSTR